MAAPGPVLTVESLNKNVVSCKYAVRGLLYAAAVQRQAEGKEVILTNVGNPHALGQKPLTFPRQVLALVTHPALLEDPAALGSFPADAVARARQYLAEIPGGTGAYQHSQGNAHVRKEVAAFISARDGVRCSHECVYLGNGASPLIQLCLRLVIRDRSDGILLPVPHYPLYSAAIELLGGTRLNYHLNENDDWSLELAELDRVAAAARARGICVRALSLVNPGNPTGQVLKRANIEAIVRWCYRERVVLLADEVYQTNTYGDEPFTACNQVIHEMPDDSSKLECMSFHTVSKGVYGECGRRGGYLHCTNIASPVREQLLKLLSINLSSNVDGQVYMGIMCNPPRPGDPSHAAFKRESDAVFKSLRRRAERLSQAFNRVPGIACNHVAGALYAFPRIEIPAGAVQEARRRGYAPDVLYCLELLDATGISVVPGSGFGQAEGSHHFRTTILPQEAVMARILRQFEDFHLDFTRRYSGHAKL